jgi:hypothetical protein
MKSQFVIGRRELFAKLATAAGALGLSALIPASAAALVEGQANSSGSATVRVILADGTSVQWMAVTSGGLTVGGKTTVGRSLNTNIVTGAIAAIVAAGGPKLSPAQVTLLGGAV